MIGTKLAHYEITQHLGSGGMGDVYQATDSKLGRSVAIKFLPEAFSHDGERVARFEREARVLASLNHPQIAAIYPAAGAISHAHRWWWHGRQLGNKLRHRSGRPHPDQHGPGRCGL